MDIDKNKIELHTYTPQCHRELLVFMISQYENRSSEYLDWWLSNLDNGGEDIWKTTILVYYNNGIIACCTSNPFSLQIGKTTHSMFYESNTIVVPEYRGCGIGKMIYSEIIKHKNRITIGLTKSAYIIQTQKIKGCYPIQDIRVYVSANKHSLTSIINKFLNRKRENLKYPDNFKISNYTFTLVKNLDDLKDYPQNGLWLNDYVELKRDKEWLKNRFVNIYRKDYYIYAINNNNELGGYVVFRKGRIYGVEFISIVDFRCKNIETEKLITKAANKIAQKNKIGFTFCMSSRLHSMIRFSPLTIRLPKKIKNITVNENIKNEEILITSADANLDFVYYE